MSASVECVSETLEASAQSIGVAGNEVPVNGSALAAWDCSAVCVDAADGALLAAGVQAAATIARPASNVANLGSRPEGRVMLALLHSCPAPIGTRVPEIAGPTRSSRRR